MRSPLSPAALCKAKKRRANLLYKLRRKGIEADTKQRVIFIPYGEEPYKHIQVVRLCREFNFNIQFIITMRFPLSPAALCKAKKRRASLLYKLRRKGIEADTKQRVIFIPYGEEPYKHIQVVRLCREFNFNIQFIIT